MKKFYIPKDKSMNIIFVFLFLFMLIFYIISKDFFALLIMLTALISIIIIVFCQRDTIVEIDEKSIKIIKLSSKILRQYEEEIPFSDIIGINRTYSRSQQLVQIRRKNELDVLIPLRINPDFDKYIFELDAKIRKEQSDYREESIKFDKTEKVYRKLAIASFILCWIIFACIIIFSKDFGLFELFLYCIAFILPLIFMGLWIGHGHR